MATRRRSMTTYLTIPVIVVLAYVFFVVYANVIGDSLLFQPRESSYRDGPGFLKVPAADGTLLSAVHLVAPDSPVTVLHLHGNAEDIGDNLPFFEEMRSRGLSVVGFDYRGYGTTPGTPDEAGIVADTRAVFRYVVDVLGVAPERVIIYGRSLGAGPGVDLAARERVGGLVLDGAFKSAFRVVTQYPLIPGDRFNNLGKIGRVKCPVLVIHGVRDMTVPFSHGEALFAAAPEPKTHLWIDAAGHNDLREVAGDEYWTALLDFARKAGGG